MNSEPEEHKKAVLADIGMRPRLTIALSSEQPKDVNIRRVDVGVERTISDLEAESVGDGLVYRFQSKMETIPKKAAASLLHLGHNAKGTAVLTLWDLGRYKRGEPLLTCTIAGDGLGGFEATLSISEGEFSLTDSFETGPSGIRLFAEALQAMGKTPIPKLRNFCEPCRSLRRGRERGE
jgi:hypothetical protein